MRGFRALLAIVPLCACLGLSASPLARQRDETAAPTGAEAVDIRGLQGEILKATRLIGMPVQDSQGRSIARLDDVVVESAEGHLLVAVLSSSQDTNRAAAIPFDLLEPVLQASGKERTLRGFHLPAERGDLEQALHVERDALDRLTGRDAVLEVYGAYGRTPPWAASDTPDGSPDAGTAGTAAPGPEATAAARTPGLPAAPTSDASAPEAPSAEEPAARQATDAGTEPTDASTTPGPSREQDAEDADATAEDTDATTAQDGAAEMEPSELEGIPASPEPQLGASLPRSPAELLRLSDVLGQSVRNAQGEQLAKLQDLVIDPLQRRIAYAVLHSDLTSSRDNLLALPWQALLLDPAQNLAFLNLEKEKLREAPAFSKNNWKQLANRQWGMDIYHYYGLQPYWEQQPLVAPRLLATASSAADPASTPATASAAPTAGSRHPPRSRPAILRATELVGWSVRNSKDEELGTIREIVLDPDHGRVLYAVLAYGGFLGIGEKLFAVPWEALRLKADARQFVLDVERAQLEAAQGFDERRWPEMGGMPFSPAPAAPAP